MAQSVGGHLIETGNIAPPGLLIVWTRNTERGVSIPLIICYKTWLECHNDTCYHDTWYQFHQASQCCLFRLDRRCAVLPGTPSYIGNSRFNCGPV